MNTRIRIGLKMRPARSRQSGTSSLLKQRERGQVLVFFMFLLLFAALLTFFHFSSSQATVAKTRLVNATDSAAYSVALWHARTMNYYAYTNRAIIANEVAIAQAATMVSFSSYVYKLADNLEDIARYFPYINQIFEAIEQIAEIAHQLTSYVARFESMARTYYNAALSHSQTIMFALSQLYTTNQLATEVGRQTAKNIFIVGMKTDVLKTVSLTRRYSDDDRQRLKDLVMRSLDPYSKDHGGTWTLSGFNKEEDWKSYLGPKVERRGQTEMIRDHDTGSFDRWQSYDTLSLHERRGFLRKRWRETLPLAWGGAEIADEAKEELDTLDRRRGGARADGNKRTNGWAYRLVSEEDDFWSQDVYLGIPTVRELDYDSSALRKNRNFPTMRIGVVGRMSQGGATDDDGGRINRVGTAEQLGIGAGRLALKDEFFARGKGLMALASAEIYFKAPPRPDSRVEYASLYSPYWQARLVPVDAAWRVIYATRP
ncbi:MAG: pilus assembly protein TadG-related protein [Lautropia sp.]|nr:pilus assembly protein TadG-related protein [Lautropia sp.]